MSVDLSSLNDEQKRHLQEQADLYFSFTGSRRAQLQVGISVVLLTVGAGWSLIASSGAPLNLFGAITICVGVLYGLIDFAEPASPHDLPRDMMRKKVASLEGLDYQSEQDVVDARIEKMYGVFDRSPEKWRALTDYMTK